MLAEESNIIMVFWSGMFAFLPTEGPLKSRSDNKKKKMATKKKTEEILFRIVLL
jgi:hypothetical protein